MVSGSIPDNFFCGICGGQSGTALQNRLQIIILLDAPFLLSVIERWGHLWPYYQGIQFHHAL
jgi:hypothetical protein